jgi:uncharacterized protein DUF6496
MARYSEGASKSVERAMHRRKKGTLRSGGSGKKVTSRKQAIAIGLSEAREKGARVPSASSSRRHRSGARKTSSRRRTSTGGKKKQAA